MKLCIVSDVPFWHNRCSYVTCTSQPSLTHFYGIYQKTTVPGKQSDEKPHWIWHQNIILLCFERGRCTKKRHFCKLSIFLRRLLKCRLTFHTSFSNYATWPIGVPLHPKGVQWCWGQVLCRRSNISTSNSSNYWGIHLTMYGSFLLSQVFAQTLFVQKLSASLQFYNALATLWGLSGRGSELHGLIDLL